MRATFLSEDSWESDSESDFRLEEQIWYWWSMFTTVNGERLFVQNCCFTSRPNDFFSLFPLF